MTSDESLATPSLNLLRRCMDVGLADPLSNHDVSRRKELMEIKCRVVRDLPIFAVKDEAFLRNTSCDELDMIR